MRTVISVRTDENTKEQARRLFSRLGIDISTAINLFLRQAIRRQGLPFEVVLSEEEISAGIMIPAKKSSVSAREL